MNDGTIKIGTEVDSKGIDAGLKKIENKARQTEQAINKLGKAGAKAGTSLDQSGKVKKTETATTGLAKAADKAEKELKQASKEVETFGNKSNTATKKTDKFKSALSKVGGFAKAGLATAGAAVGAVTAAMGAGVAQGVKYNSLIEGYATSFEVMTGSAEKASEVVNQIKQIAAKTPFEIPQLAETTKLLMNYGLTADDALGKMQMLGDISQGNADKMQRIATAYGQMSSAGKVHLEDVKQMIEAGFNPLQEISKTTGESMESLYNRISNGTLTVDEITSSMERATSAGGQYFQSMEKQSQTFKGLMSTLGDNAKQLLGEVVQPIFDGITKTALPGAIGAVEQLTTAFREQGVQGLATAGGDLLGGLLSGIIEKLPHVVAVALTVVTSLAESLISNVGLIGNAAVTIVFTLLLAFWELLPQLFTVGLQLITTLLQGITAQLPTVIAAMFTVIDGMFKALTDPVALEQLLMAALMLIVTLADGLLQNLPTLIDTAIALIQNLITALINTLPQLVPVAVELLMTLANGLVTNIPKLLAAIPQIISAVINTFRNTDWGQIGRDMIDGISAGLKKGISKIKETVKSVVDTVKSTFKKLLRINSPSKETEEYGKFTDEGFAVGVDKNKKKIDSAIRNLKITDKFKSVLPTAQASVSSRLALATAGITSGGAKSVSEIIRTNNNTTTQRLEIVPRAREIFDIVVKEGERRGKKL